MGHGGAKAAKLHLDYIQRDGVGEAGQAGALYNRQGSADVAEFSAPLPGEARQFRFIVAPEDGSDLDLPAFTRRLMAQMEADLGRTLIWAASDHHNTDNPHTHVVIRGVDGNGQDLRIDRDYIKNGFRNRAVEFATEELGLRTERHLEQQLRKEVEQQRFTSLDKEIARRAKDGRLDLTELHRDKYMRARLVGRVGTLAVLGLARAQGGAHWVLVKDWETTLRQLGEHADIIKRIHQGLGATPARPEVFPPVAPTGTHEITGIIRAKGLHDELKGTFFAVIESTDGRAHYVELPPRQAAERVVGDLVRVVSEPYPAAAILDAAIARLAKASGNKITQEMLPGLAAEARVPGGARAVQKHLDALRPTGVVSTPSRAWAVPPDLEQRLVARPSERQVRRLLVRVLDSRPVRDQERYRGPTWLDQAAAADIRAVHGFGAAVAAARARRERFLATLGLDPAGPNTAARLRALERDTFGLSLEKGSGGQHLKRAPRAFTGQLEMPPAPLASGQRVSIVRDQRSGDFLVLPRSHSHKDLDGKRVTVGRDQTGRTSLREEGPDRDR